MFISDHEWRMFIRKHTHSSALTLLLCEYLSTLSVEIRLVWRERKSSTKYKFLFCRYAPLGCLIANLTAFHLLDGERPLMRSRCVAWASLQAGVLFTLTVVVESVQSLKVYAFYSQHPKTLLILRVLRVLALIMTIYSFVSSLSVLEYDGACHVTSLPRQVGWLGYTFLATQVVVVFLLLYPRIVRENWRTSSLIATTSRDSVCAFFALAAFSSWIATKGSSYLILPTTLCVLSISGCRMIINMISQLRTQDIPDNLSQDCCGTTQFSTVVNETSMEPLEAHDTWEP